MAIVVEDGSGTNPNANAYADSAFVIAYAASRGVSIDPDTADSLIINGMDYIEAFRARFKGFRTFPETQPLQWPRTGVTIEGAKIPVSGDWAIPKELKAALAQLCIEQANGIDISPTVTRYAVTREKVDVIEVEYATGGSSQPAVTDPVPNMPKVKGLLSVLMGSSMFLTTVRV